MDLALRNATVIDGTGRPRFNGDVGIRGDKIVAIGTVDGRAKEEIDVDGAVVAPGFIDCHTHYDAQVMWDDMLGPSVYHGVTTVLAGNCGFTLAPLTGRKADADYLLAMLSRVEGMPLTALKAAVNPTWESFGQYLDAIDGRIAVNTAFMVGHSALRRCVMGERAVGTKATPDDLKAMVKLLRQSLVAGGTGFSTTVSPSHSDHNGDPVPSRWATDEELLTLAGIVGEYPGTWLELLPAAGGMFKERQYKLATDMSLAAKRMLNWNAILADSRHKDFVESQLVMGTYAAERGAKVYALSPASPVKAILNFRSGFGLDMIAGWNDVLRLPDDQKIKAMMKPEVRARLQNGLDSCTSDATALFGDPGSFLIEDVRSEKNARWKQHFVSDYAAAVGLSPLDALLQLAVEEELWMTFSPPPIGADDESWDMRGKLWRNPYCIPGASDAGAHLDLINTFALSTDLLGEGVRKRGLLSLEEGVRLITGLPAEIFGLTGRGRITHGAAADLVVFDPDAIGCAPIEMRNDLPSGEARLYADSIGIEYVIVNGVPVAKGNTPTGRKGGRVLRAGRDTHTVSLN
jgi:N-acyl-D-aspartate/D-glutamate deacylase